jgi:mRNA interferase RelE/StbE
MMPEGVYTVRIRRSPEKTLDRLPPQVTQRLIQAIQRLRNAPRPRGSIKLRGSRLRRIRIGDYRVLYDLDDAQRVIDVLDIGHRRDIYRGLDS